MPDAGEKGKERKAEPKEEKIENELAEERRKIVSETHDEGYPFHDMLSAALAPRGREPEAAEKLDAIFASWTSKLKKAVDEKDDKTLGDIGGGRPVKGIRKLMGSKVFFDDLSSINSFFQSDIDVVSGVKRVMQMDAIDAERLGPEGVLTKVLLLNSQQMLMITEQRLHIAETPLSDFQKLNAELIRAAMHLSMTKKPTVGMYALINATGSAILRLLEKGTDAKQEAKEESSQKEDSDHADIYK